MSLIDIPPYSTGHLFESIVDGCCGTSCTNLKVINIYRNVTEINLAAKLSPDFILPFLGNSDAATLHGYHFIPFIDTPPVYYITHKHPTPLSQMMSDFMQLIPLLVFCLLAAVVSGFIVWVTETVFRRKGSERQSFFQGVFEGFWWSFTIVTSGYGAKVVSSVPAKLYSVVWIFVGVIGFSLMTSFLTAELMASIDPPVTFLSGAVIGALKYRKYDSSVVVQKGGNIRLSDATDFTSDVDALIKMLQRREVDGIVLDKYTLVYVTGYLRWRKDNPSPGTRKADEEERRLSIDYFLETAKHTLKHFQAVNEDSNNKLSYGVLVKKIEDYNFFKNAMQDNRLFIEILTASAMNEVFPKKEQLRGPLHNLIDCTGLFKWAGVVIACLCLFGVAYETFKQQTKLFDCGGRPSENHSSRYLSIEHGKFVRKCYKLVDFAKGNKLHADTAENDN